MSQLIFQLNRAALELHNHFDSDPDYGNLTFAVNQILQGLNLLTEPDRTTHQYSSNPRESAGFTFWEIARQFQLEDGPSKTLYLTTHQDRQYLAVSRENLAKHGGPFADLPPNQKGMIFEGISQEALFALAEFIEADEPIPEKHLREILTFAKKNELPLLEEECRRQLKTVVTDVNKAMLEFSNWKEFGKVSELRMYLQDEELPDDVREKGENLCNALEKLDFYQADLGLNPLIIRSPDSLPFIVSSPEKLTRHSHILELVVSASKGPVVFEGYNSDQLYEIVQTLETGDGSFLNENILQAYRFFTLWECETLRVECLEIIVENSALFDDLPALFFARDIQDKPLITALLLLGGGILSGKNNTILRDFSFFMGDIYQARPHLTFERKGIDFHLKLKLDDLSDSFDLVDRLFKDGYYITAVTLECNDPKLSNSIAQIIREHGPTSTLNRFTLITKEKQVTAILLPTLLHYTKINDLSIHASEGLETIDPLLPHLHRFKSLNLNNTPLTPTQVELLLSALKYNTSLQRLGLSKSPLATDNIEILCHLPTLQKLDLSHTGLGTKSLRRLMSALKENTTLTDLDISGNFFDPTAIDIQEFISKHS